METAAQNPLENFFLGVGAQLLHLVPGVWFLEMLFFCKGCGELESIEGSGGGHQLPAIYHSWEKLKVGSCRVSLEVILMS